MSPWIGEVKCLPTINAAYWQFNATSDGDLSIFWTRLSVSWCGTTVLSGTFTWKSTFCVTFTGDYDLPPALLSEVPDPDEAEYNFVSTTNWSANSLANNMFLLNPLSLRWFVLYENGWITVIYTPWEMVVCLAGEPVSAWHDMSCRWKLIGKVPPLDLAWPQCLAFPAPT